MRITGNTLSTGKGFINSKMCGRYFISTVIRGSQELVFHCEFRKGFSNQKVKDTGEKATSDIESEAMSKKKVSASCELPHWSLGEKYEDKKQCNFFPLCFP